MNLNIKIKHILYSLQVVNLIRMNKLLSLKLIYFKQKNSDTFDFLYVIKFFSIKNRPHWGT